VWRTEDRASEVAAPLAPIQLHRRKDEDASAKITACISPFGLPIVLLLAAINMPTASVRSDKSEKYERRAGGLPNGTGPLGLLGANRGNKWSKLIPSAKHASVS
jgi:hypothetical protein